MCSQQGQECLVIHPSIPQSQLWPGSKEDERSVCIPMLYSALSPAQQSNPVQPRAPSHSWMGMDWMKQFAALSVRDRRGSRNQSRFINKIVIKGKSSFRKVETICQISQQSARKERRKLFHKNLRKVQRFWQLGITPKILWFGWGVFCSHN